MVSFALISGNQHGLPLDTVVMREDVSESWSEKTC